MDAHAFLVALSIVLGVAAVTTVIFQKLRQPVVLGYILAGFIIGPNVPIPLVADRQIVQTLSELGVILLMFSLGLEFSLSKLAKLGPAASLLALLQSSLMIWLGFVTGQMFGWTTLESLFCGAIIAISSTTIIAKAFDEQGVRGSLRDLVVGVLIVEDLIAILLMTTLTAVATGSGLSAMEFAKTTGKLGLFLALLMGVGLLLVPRAVRAVQRLGRPETTLVASIGFCFAVSLLAHSAGYSVALGAFIAGSLIAESGEAKPIEHLVQPVRDVFAAIFFVSVGVLIDPQVLVDHWPAVAVITGVVIVGKIVGVTLGAFLTGSGVRTSVQAGFSLAQIGEFSFIIAGLGLSLKATGAFLYPVAVAVSAITTLTTPWLIKASGPVATYVDRKMPRPLQTFVTLYASWLQSFGAQPRGKGSSLRRLLRLTLLDLTLLIALTLGCVLGMSRLTVLAEARLGLAPTVAHVSIIAVTASLALPLVLGVVRLARELGLTLALAALPRVEDEGSVDLAATPRRALIVTLQLAVVLLAGLLFLVVTQPFLGGGYAPALFGVLLVVLGARFWRGATELHGHVRAGAQVVLEALVEQAHRGGVDEPKSAPHHADLTAVQRLLPGLGEPTPVALEPSSPAVGRSLSQLNLRGVTGASVLAIQRGEEGVLVPTATDVLRVGDVLALTGTHAAIDAARALLAAQSELPSSPLAV
ncbi:MAG: potassium/proton antiporter rosb [Polyangiaceae bacterium]|jgi:CPA2 family monovalent cation:H+ antiporter-2|nr:potassium/proton antiporter rosb [Polyangiaceae bacterium]